MRFLSIDGSFLHNASNSVLKINKIPLSVDDRYAQSLVSWPVKLLGLSRLQALYTGSRLPPVGHLQYHSQEPRYHPPPTPHRSARASELLKILVCSNSRHLETKSRSNALPSKAFLRGKIFRFSQSLFVLCKQWYVTGVMTPSKTILKPFWVRHSLTKAKFCPSKTMNSPKPGKTLTRIPLDRKKDPVQIQIPHFQARCTVRCPRYGWRRGEGINWSAHDVRASERTLELKLKTALKCVWCAVICSLCYVSTYIVFYHLKIKNEEFSWAWW